MVCLVQVRGQSALVNQGQKQPCVLQGTKIFEQITLSYLTYIWKIARL